MGLKNKIISQDEQTTVFEVRYKNEIYPALIDTDDFNELPYRSVCVMSKKWKYLQIWNNGKTKYLHRIIMNTPYSFETDHINGNVLDNRKSNLRICTHQQNLWNSGNTHNRKLPKGVRKSSMGKGYEAIIDFNHKRYYIGYFHESDVAGEAYDVFAKNLRGEFYRGETK